MSQTRTPPHSRLLRFAWPLLLLVAAIEPCAAQVQPEQQPPAASMMVGREQFVARTLPATPDRLEFRIKDSNESRVLSLQPELLQQLRIRPGQEYRVLAVQKPTAGGILSAVKLADARGLYAIAESIRDVKLWTPADRNGIRVEQLPAEERTFAYETQCVTVYNVPTRFTIEDRRIVLQAYESRQVTIGDASYTLTLNSSQFVVAKECSIPLEGGRARVDYTLVRD